MTVDSDNPNAESPREPTQYRIGSDEPPSLAVVRAVAAATGRDQVDSDAGADALAPLAETIDPEALDALFESRRDRPGAAPLVEFGYCDRHVTVSGGESVCVTVR